MLSMKNISQTAQPEDEGDLGEAQSGLYKLALVFKKKDGGIDDKL